jgi:hypothetical protein
MFKRIGILLIVTGCLTSTFSQSKNIDSLLLHSKHKKFTLDETKDFFMINLTMDNMLTNGNDTGYKSNWFNPNVGFYLMYDVPIGKTGFSIAPGIGLTFNKVNLSNSMLSQDSSGSRFQAPKYDAVFKNNSNYTYTGSNVYNSWLEVPFELKWKSKPITGRSRIKVALGARVGLKLASESSYSYNDTKQARDIDVSVKPFTDVNSIRYGLTFRLGYSFINLFAYYGLNQYFKDAKNPTNEDLRQYSVGIAITSF